MKIARFSVNFILFFLFIAGSAFFACAQDDKQLNPIVVNGDRVEYSADSKEVSITGNVLITYKGSRMTADKVKVNTITKDAVATGNVRLEDEKGLIEAESLLYNFENKKGTMLQAKVKAGDQYGKGEQIERMSETQFQVNKGYLTTCNYDEPHFRIFSKKIDITTGDKIVSHNDLLYIGKTPVMYIPEYTHSLKDTFTHFQVRPGYTSEWGPYLLTTYRDDIGENVKLRLLLDYRVNRGMAQGMGLNYDTLIAGKGDFKFYYMDEKDKKERGDLPVTAPTSFERYLARWRHSWTIDPKTNLVSEYYKIQDPKRNYDPNASFLKEYFYREYETDVRPKSYVLLTHGFDEGIANVIFQKRVNSWYTQTEKLPELSYDLSNMRLGESPFYFTDASKISHLSYQTAAPSDRHYEVTRIDTLNQVSLPTKVSFLWLTPFVGSRETYYSHDKDGNSLGIRTAFTSGTEISTKFYRIFNAKSDLLGMNINGLRHVITPVIRYTYIHEPTISASKLHPDYFTTDEENEFFDLIDNVERTNDFNIEITNKLQTKRNGSTVDLAMFRVLTDYRLRNDALGSRFSDIFMETELTPYKWLRFDADATYGYREGFYKMANADVHFDFGVDRSLGIGQRYERKGPKNLVSQLTWRLNPKWKFKIYERFQLYSNATPKGLIQQQYSISRDLHCWTIDFTYDYQKVHGHSVWMVFRLNAFPDIELGFDAHYDNPQATTTGN